ncbi:hypothetical protein ONZ45_g5661 [Pleurotus djamor]|nr:hypothetical protein ONZ45_g12777 [Pleurotus djamor]KAJ8517124.1 hypothetical protein ONZ45_g5661 [Pleurotus djamor]
MSDSPAIGLERAIYYGLVFMCIIYGLEVYMFAHTAYIAVSNRVKHRVQMSYIVIGGLMLALVTIATFVNIVFLEFMWIDHRDVEGGPLGYLAANSSIWWQTLGTLSDQLTNFLGDGLMLYRVYIICDSGLLVLIFPVLLYLSSIAMALLTVVQSAVPGSNFFVGKTVNFGVPWVALSVTINVYCTVAIVWRLYLARKQMQEQIGLAPEIMDTYTGVTAILVESSLPFSVLGIVFAVTFGKNLDAGPPFAFIWGTFCALSPQFILYRVALGTAWSRDIASQIQSQSLEFASVSRGHTASSATQGVPPSTLVEKSSFVNASSGSDVALHAV